MNAVEIEQAVFALAEQPFDRGEFPIQFLTALGKTARRRDSILRLTVSRWRPLVNIIPASRFAGGSLDAEADVEPFEAISA